MNHVVVSDYTHLVDNCAAPSASICQSGDGNARVVICPSVYSQVWPFFFLSFFNSLATLCDPTNSWSETTMFDSLASEARP